MRDAPFWEQLSGDSKVDKLFNANSRCALACEYVRYCSRAALAFGSKSDNGLPVKGHPFVEFSHSLRVGELFWGYLHSHLPIF